MKQYIEFLILCSLCSAYIPTQAAEKKENKIDIEIQGCIKIMESSSNYPYYINVNVDDSGNITSTLKDLKNEIEEQKKIPVEQQSFLYQGEPIKDTSKPLQEYGIKIESSVQLILPQRRHGINKSQQKIFVKKPNNNLLEIILDFSKKIKYLKKKIAEKTSIAPEYQQLTFKNNTLEDNQTLAHYHIAPESTIILVTAQKKKNKQENGDDKVTSLLERQKDTKMNNRDEVKSISKNENDRDNNNNPNNSNSGAMPIIIGGGIFIAVISTIYVLKNSKKNIKKS